MTVLGRGVDELDVGGLGVRSADRRHDGLSKGNSALLSASNAALNHEPVLVDNTVVGEATHGGDGLLSEVSVGRGRGLVVLSAETEDSLVDLSSVVVAHLTGTGNSVAYTGRMPGTDTGDLAETSVGLSGKSGDAPTSDNTVESTTTSGGADVDNFTLSEDGANRDGLLKESLGEVYLISDSLTVDLDFHQVGNLLSESQLADLGVSQNTNNLALVLDISEVLLVISGLGSDPVGILGESFALGLVPVLVESSLDFVTQVGSPDGLEASQAGRGGTIADDTNDNHRRSLEDGDSLNSLLLVQLGARSVDLSDDVGHAGLVGNEGGHVAGLGRIILGEGPYATSVVPGALLGEEL
jgi:hypothetical protein